MKYIFIFFSICFCISLQAQNTESVEIVDVNNLPHDQVFFPCSFGQDDLQTIKELDELRFQVVTEVALVYTAFRSSKSFDQEALNASRKQALKKVWPELFDQELINWRYFEQTAALTKNEALRFPHGYLITYRPKSTEELTDTELNALETMVAEGRGRIAIDSELYTTDGWVDLGTSTAATYPEGLYVFSNFLMSEFGSDPLPADYQASISFEIDPTGRMTNLKVTGDSEVVEKIKKGIAKADNWIPATRNGKAVTEPMDILWKYHRKKHEYHVDYNAAEAVAESILKTNMANRRNSEISTVMDRNNWQNMAVVLDVTGSMYPYSADFILWAELAENVDGINSMTVFNDGDMTPDAKKRVGRVGGIYSREVKHFEDVSDVIRIGMSNGGGGDLPENNIEAVLETLERFPETESLVMIADNFATPRDLELLAEVKVPIRLVLCGAFGGVNPAYMDMIRQNGGSIHTIEKDINDLTNLQEGEIVMISGVNYTIKNGKFIRAARV